MIKGKSIFFWINDNDISVLKQVVMVFESTFCKTEQVFNKAEGHGGLLCLMNCYFS